MAERPDMRPRTNRRRADLTRTLRDLGRTPGEVAAVLGLGEPLRHYARLGNYLSEQLPWWRDNWQHNDGRIEVFPHDDDDPYGTMVSARLPEPVERYLEADPASIVSDAQMHAWFWGAMTAFGRMVAVADELRRRPEDQ